MIMSEDLKAGDRVRHVDYGDGVAVVKSFPAFGRAVVQWESTGRESEVNLAYLVPVKTDAPLTDEERELNRRDVDMGDGFTLREHLGGPDGTPDLWDVFCGAFIGRYKTRAGALRRIERLKQPKAPDAFKCPECGAEMERWEDPTGSGYQCLKPDCLTLTED